ncbi:MAG: neutral/alkaline non-lysosomal ceramidase N-terminal domain-containing protein [Candidatus Hydrogenedentes bacterium]|nr:neutral/alkaline non-lysosomal ceramidase N-terminal domain-containing protein [Candidatus Hydrogenedentota bacterium]
MSKLKKILLGLVVFVVALVALFLAVIGPWPVYSDSKFAESDYYRDAMAAIEKETAKSIISDAPGLLQAGWASRIMTPDVGVPMGGYGARPDGKKSTGVRDELMVKAIAISDGVNVVVLLGTDMLIIPPNIAEMTLDKVSKTTPLGANNVYFTASHTHCGPGAFAPGLAAKISGGEYDPKVPDFLSGVFADAIVSAYADMKPALITHGVINAKQYIRNRTRDTEVDGALNYMIAKQEGGRQCYVTRISAHPTIFGHRMMEFSGEFPGEMMRYIEAQTHGTAIYLGGAVGSMSTRAPDAPSPSERVTAMGQAFGQLLLNNIPKPDFKAYANVASVGVNIGVPPIQVRPISPKWRLSAVASKILGVPPEGRIQGARIGDMLFIGLPFDVSGELAHKWQQRASEQGWDLWVTGFSGAYLGYLSPDCYYNEVDDDGQLDYETGLMSWCGPNAEAYFGALINKVIEGFTPVSANVFQPIAVL